ncbi:hypothetical protein QR680_006201 [Steinernema hermaphroditum]|uniref:Uncharacterized protein n=1 Tax=Steinernema hermaphroditum TaxID=289476 RepID=A0AA39HWZ9_9BILA|nr:hypothetical protein QR680_006201 [Steinernema hermaphroditum]
MAFIMSFVRVQNWIRIASMPFNLFIIVLSFTKVRSSLARTYALNISATMLVSSLFTHTYQLMDLLALRNTTCAIALPANKVRPTCSYILGVTNGFLTLLSINIYYFQATLTVVIAYVSCAFPHGLKLDQKWRTNSMFLMCYILAIYVSLTMSFDTYELTDMSLQVAFSVTRSIFQTVAIVAMIIFYCLAVVHIMKHAKKVANLSGSSKAKWNCLRSILIYCTPPNLFLFISLPEVICLPLTYNFDSTNMTQAICAHIDILALVLFSPRMLVTSMSALIAFRDYRVALLKIFRKFFGSIRNKGGNVTMVTPMTRVPSITVTLHTM